MTRQEIEDRKNVLFSLVKDREAKLMGSDYVAAKLAEGVTTKEEYADVLAERAQARKEINSAEEEIAELEKAEPEEEKYERIVE